MVALAFLWILLTLAVVVVKQILSLAGHAFASQQIIPSCLYTSSYVYVFFPPVTLIESSQARLSLTYATYPHVHFHSASCLVVQYLAQSYASSPSSSHPLVLIAIPVNVHRTVFCYSYLSCSALVVHAHWCESPGYSIMPELSIWNDLIMTDAQRLLWSSRYRAYACPLRLLGTFTLNLFL
ncbi:hypothetical protein BD626DRAFT_511198 [Schizophyllum amplum]|uniref:Secreted protein n=1 Tax=Schizophyllum amplum TaxID=97359 RepID=A0A550C0Z9_9AGAR|nr:hypothetical protein BD626DRAFT_511198 [Auriculariopsis ampla]